MLTQHPDRTVARVLLRVSMSEVDDDNERLYVPKVVEKLEYERRALLAEDVSICSFFSEMFIHLPV